MALINCKECGHEVSDAAKVCPNCGAPVIRDVFCPKCGTKVPEDTKFCPVCGEKIVPLSDESCEQGITKDKVVAGLLAIFLGGLGIHYFYLGKTTAGLITILLSLCSCGFWYIIIFVQGIVMLTMQEDVFYERYVDNDRTFPLF